MMLDLDLRDSLAALAEAMFGDAGAEAKPGEGVHGPAAPSEAAADDDGMPSAA